MFPLLGRNFPAWCGLICLFLLLVSASTLEVIAKKSLPRPVSKIFSFLLCSGVFHNLVFKSLIHVGWILLYGESKLSFPSSPCGLLFFPEHISWKNLCFFPLCILCIFIEDPSLANVRIRFSSSDAFSCQYYAILMAPALWYILESGSVWLELRVPLVSDYLVH